MNKGFTLLEIIISVGILAIVSILMAQVLFTATHVNKKSGILIDTKQNGNFALDIISRMTRSATSIETSCVQGATYATSVRITNPDTNATTFTCVSDGTVARVASQSATTGTVYLSDGNVTLSVSGGADCSDSSLTFSCPPTNSVQNQVTVTFSLRKSENSGSAFETGNAVFQSTIGLRN